MSDMKNSSKENSVREAFPQNYNDRALDRDCPPAHAAGFATPGAPEGATLATSSPPSSISLRTVRKPP
jgi:hypothetical protein